MEVTSPPHYRRLSGRPGPAPSSADELPPYTPPSYTRRNTSAQPVIRRGPTEHIYHLTEKNRAWITLKLLSSAKSSQSLPTYFEKETIDGTLEINAEKGDSIHSITAIVTGRIITGAHSGDSFTFLSQSVPIWSKSTDARRNPLSSEVAPQPKLLGHHKLPLSISLPRQVNLPNDRGGTDTCPLPETFLERQTPVSIQYDFTILISRGKLRADNQLTTAFGYVPISRPEPPSLLRQVAYQHCHPLPGPQMDSEGWRTLRTVVAKGTISNAFPVEVQCVLSLGKPMSYTRGGVIPCYLTLQGSDAKALQLFSTPTAVSLCLQRRVRFYSKPLQSRSEVAWHESCEDMGSAVWWPAPEASGNPNIHHLEGEIKLPRDLRPTTCIGHFSVSYQITFRPFNARGFQSDGRILLSEPVEIVTMYAKGPRPRAYSPPTYTPDDRMF